jgi:hypothetical protein
MNEAIRCQGRHIFPSDLSWLRDLVAQHPDWSRHKLTQHLCQHWGWQTHTGHLKTFAARSLIDALEQRGLLTLPPIRVACRRSLLPPFRKGFMPPDATPIDTSLKNVTPLSIHIPSPNSSEASCVGYYLNHYHYLGFTRTVGEHLTYLVQDHSGQNLACLLFGSAAWATAPRDTFIGWKPATRAANLTFLTNNTRFLILPWVRVPHLASHILGRVMRRLQQDWIEKYGHPVHLVETFVECARFKGICYKAANWLHVGHTQGRSRQDRHNDLRVPVKAIYLYPLSRHFRQALCRSQP